MQWLGVGGLASGAARGLAHAASRWLAKALRRLQRVAQCQCALAPSPGHSEQPGRCGLRSGGLAAPCRRIAFRLQPKVAPPPPSSLLQRCPCTTTPTCAGRGRRALWQRHGFCPQSAHKLNMPPPNPGSTQAVGDVCFGSVMGPSSQRANECRIAMFLAGFPTSVPVHTVNRQCSSGGLSG